MVLATPLVPLSAKLLPVALVILTNCMFVNVKGARLPALIVLPEMVTERPCALKFSVLGPAVELPPLTVIGVVAEGVILNISLPVEFAPIGPEANQRRSQLHRWDWHRYWQ
jgi:hypothetical protein